MRETLAIHVSWWEKGDKITKITSKYKNGSKAGTFYFQIYNPFPCFNMMSTYHVVSGWLKANGWKQREVTIKKYITDEISDETGEILNHWEVVKEMIDGRKVRPVR